MNTLKLLNSLKIALKETSAKKTSLKINYLNSIYKPDGRLIRNYNHEDHYHRGLDLPNDWMHEHRASNISMKDIVV